MSDSEKWRVRGYLDNVIIDNRGYEIAADVKDAQTASQIVSEHNAHRELVEALKKIAAYPVHSALAAYEMQGIASKALSTIKEK